MSRETQVIGGETIDAKIIEALRAGLSGELFQPGDEQYQKASQGWNLNARQRPALVMMAESVKDIMAAVQVAGDANIGVGVMSTGHGIGTPCDGGLLINISRMRGVKIDPAFRTAKVEAGAVWNDVIPVAHAHGLAGLVGSAPHVGVVGYTLGGGFGYLGRKYGLNSSQVIAADMVTAEGNLAHVSSNENTDLFWALKGGVGNFGVVTSLEFRLFPLTTVYGGAVFYPVENAREVLNLYARWTANLPDEITAAFAFMNFPPLPMVPETLRGRSVVVIKGCYCGAKPEMGEEMFRPIRTEVGQSIIDTFGSMSVTAMDTISKDPVDPMGVLQFGVMISDLSEDAIETLLRIAGPGSPLASIEIRRLGGAVQPNSKEIKILGSGVARYSLNALGATSTSKMAESVAKHLTILAEATRQYQTGETFVNFIEVDPTVDRVRSAYTAEDWERLVALKTQYDPRNIFRFNRNIPPRSV